MFLWITTHIPWTDEHKIRDQFYELIDQSIYNTYLNIVIFKFESKVKMMKSYNF